MKPRPLLTLTLTLLTLTAAAPATVAGPVPLADEVLATSVPAPTWIGRDVPTGRNLASVHFHNATLGWVGAEDGAVYRTLDGGRSWEVFHTGLRQTLVAMDWVDARHGWVGAPDGGIARTLDGGLTWEVVDGGGWMGDFHHLEFHDENTGFHTGRNAIYRGYLKITHDGGATWDLMSLDYPTTESDFRTVDFTPDLQRGIVATWLWPGIAGVSLTEDGGDTWDFVTVAEGLASWNDLAMATEDVGVLVGPQGKVFRTTDRGYTWLPVPVPTAANLRDADFVDTQRGWIVGETGTVLTTLDGGLTWSLEASGTGTGLRAAAFTPDGDGWAVGSAGTLRFRAVDASVREHTEQVAPLPSGDPHARIVVHGDEGFGSASSGVRAGSGTPEDPYVIEGWDIMPSLGDGITLVDTTAHVIIRHNYVHDSGLQDSAIRLVNAENVVIRDNVLENTHNGVFADDGANLTLLDNEIRSMRRAGVDVTDTRDVTLHNNLIEGSGGAGAELAGVTNAHVRENAFVFNRLAGLRLALSGGAGTADATVADNRFQDNRYGLHATRAPGLTVTGNDFTLSERDGALLELTDAAVVRANTFASNSDNGLRVRSATGMVVESNVFVPAHIAVKLENDADTIVRNNTISSDLFDAQAIRASGSERLLVTGNTVTGVYMAVRLEDAARHSIVRDNVLHPDSAGVWIMGGSSDNLVEGNLMSRGPYEHRWNTIHDGVVILGGSHGNTVRDNDIRGVSVGVAIGGSSLDNVVEGNRIRDVDVNGLSVALYSTGTILRDNVIENVGRHAVWLFRRADHAVVEGNVIRNVSKHALSVGSVSDAVFRNNVIENLTVAYASYEECPMGEAYCDNDRNLVENNTFLDVRGTGALADNATFRGQTKDLTVLNNVLQGTGTAVDLRDAPGTVLTGNNLDGFTTGLTAARSGAVDARHNWWGAADGPSGDGPGSGAPVTADAASTVQYDPWLTDPNPDAGA